MRHQALIPLSRDHHHALRMAHRLLRAADSSDAAARREEAFAFADFFAHEAATHFHEEEDVIFPLLAPGHPLVAQAVAEHARLRALTARLEARAREQQAEPKLLAELGGEMEAHVRFEERELFVAIQHEVDSDELDAAAARMAPEEAGTARTGTGEHANPGALIRAEHEELLPHLDHLRSLAYAAEDEPEERLRERLLHVRQFLRGAILVHAGLEEESVYPAAEQLLRRHGGATRTMEIDHELIGAHVDELDAQAQAPAYDAAVRSELRRVLIALEALLRGHFEKEERVYVPLLEELAPEEAAALAEQLQTASTSHHHDH